MIFGGFWSVGDSIDHPSKGVVTESLDRTSATPSALVNTNGTLIYSADTDALSLLDLPRCLLPILALVTELLIDSSPVLRLPLHVNPHISAPPSP